VRYDAAHEEHTVLVGGAEEIVNLVSVLLRVTEISPGALSCTIMATDKTGHGVPVAFIITSSSSAETYATVLDNYRQHVGTDIRSKYILVDDAAAEIGAIKQCEWGKEGTLVALCTWHVKRSWLKALISKVRGKDAVTSKSARVQLLKSLGRIVEAKVLPPQPPPPTSPTEHALLRRRPPRQRRFKPPSSLNVHQSRFLSTTTT
jgi:hypothetical protein